MVVACSVEDGTVGNRDTWSRRRQGDQLLWYAPLEFRSAIVTRFVVFRRVLRRGWQMLVAAAGALRVQNLQRDALQQDQGQDATRALSPVSPGTGPHHITFRWHTSIEPPIVAAAQRSER